MRKFTYVLLGATLASFCGGSAVVRHYQERQARDDALWQQLRSSALQPAAAERTLLHEELDIIVDQCYGDADGKTTLQDWMPVYERLELGATPLEFPPGEMTMRERFTVYDILRRDADENCWKREFEHSLDYSIGGK